MASVTGPGPDADERFLAPSRRRTVMRQTLVLVVAAVLAAAMLVLGIWQMVVYRSQGKESLEARAAIAPVSLDTELDAGAAPGSLYGRQVTLRGSYLTQPPVLVGIAPPYRVVSALRDQNRVVAVVRGTVPSLTSRVPAAPTGVVEQSGVLLPSEGSSTDPLPTGAPASMLASVNLERLAQTWPEGVLPGFVTLSASAAKAQGLDAATVTLPDDASGRAQNLGYAMQWWVFAVFTVAMGLVISRSIGRRGRDETTGDETLADAD